MTFALVGQAKNIRNAMVFNKRLISIGLAVLSALLLAFSFPMAQCWWFAWVALVPVLIVLDQKDNPDAVGVAYLMGFLFFVATLWWILYVTWPGMLLLMAYLAAYIAVFAIGYRFFAPLPLLLRVGARACVWVVLEYARTYLFTGFGWALLGHSQLPNTLFVQVADITGVYGVSFLVISSNLLLAETYQAIKLNQKGMRHLVVGWVVFSTFVLGAYGYGAYTLAQAKQYPTVNVGVVQSNIPQEIKWLPQLQNLIVDKHVKLSALLKNESLDLLVWPETALPGVTADVPNLVETINEAAKRQQTPILYGAITQVDKKYFNSALLVDASGKLAGQYDKIHLVPFGEFLPLRPILGWINRFIGLEDFTSGTTFHLFDVGGQKRVAGVLICFEDTLSDIRRHFAKAGAKLFINMTNDAWFKDTQAPFMHLQAAAFGCVEHKRALIRAANTGFSGFIDPYGRVIKSVINEKGKQTFIAAVASAQVPLVSTMTFYTKYADLFTFLCCCAILAATIFVLRFKKDIKEGVRRV